MRARTAIAIALTLGGVTSHALGAPPAAPATPAKSPAATEQTVPADNMPRVLVLPFEELSDAPKREWVGKAIQQSLVAELTRGGLVSVVTPAADSKPVKDAAGAAQAARDVRAPLVITGTYQLIDQDLRVTGQMLEAINGEPVAGMKATGNLRDLFGIEDILGAQVKRDLQAILQPGVPATQPSPQPLVQQGRTPGDPFDQRGPVKSPPPLGAYDGSELQRSLDNGWSPPSQAAAQSGYDRYRYTYPYPYPPYSYYDYCGYDYGGYWPIIVGPIVPAGPSGSTKLPPNNNFAIHPPHTMQGVPGQQMNRNLGAWSRNNTNFNEPPGQSGRSSGGNFIGSPGQSGRSSGGNSMGTSGQSGRSSGGNSMGTSGQSGRSSSGNTMKNASSR